MSLPGYSKSITEVQEHICWFNSCSALFSVHQVEKVTVEEGRRRVVLPFKATRRLLSEDITVEWKLSDMEDKVLYSYHGGVPTPSQDPVRDHAEMNGDLTTGDLSLTIKDIHLNDGVYTCTIYDKERKTLQQKVVVLIVRGQ